MRLILVHSPYLGPSSWEPTAQQMRTMGHAVEVPDLRGSLRGELCASSFIVALRAASGRSRCGPAVLVGHSRAGPLLPAAAAGSPAVAALLYVDAALPYPGRSWAEQTPPERVAMIRRKAVAGRLPRWSDWWDDPAVMERLVPDPGVRAQLIEDMPRVPSRFLDERLPTLAWPRKAGYLQLSTAYAPFADAARGAGWPVTTRDLDHLAIATAPAAVASVIATLLPVLAPTSA